MKNTSSRIRVAGLTLSLAPLACIAPASSWGCATCGCTLNADAAMGYSATPGWRIGFEYDYIHQDELRSGTHKVSTVPDGSELENETLNRYLTVSLDYSPSPDWNVGLKVPYVKRTHSTYGEIDAGEPLPDLSYSRSSSLGDIRIVSSYQGFLSDKNLGVQLGVKLPTGRSGTDIKFASGPLRGEPLDASLQPGTGSTDIIVGAYYVQPFTLKLSGFANVQFQSALKSRQDVPGNDYRPGNSTSLSAGLRYQANERWVPQFQMNFLHKGVDQGALADITDTAGSVVYASPGLTVRVIPALQVYAFAQLPVYSNLVGNQVFPRYTFSIGTSYAF